MQVNVLIFTGHHLIFVTTYQLLMEGLLMGHLMGQHWLKRLLLIHCVVFMMTFKKHNDQLIA